MTTTETPAAVTPGRESQAAIFAREHAKGAAQKMLAALDEVRDNAARIMKIALAVSMPHQISFLLGLVIPHLHWSSPVEITHSVGSILLVLGAPVIADLLIVVCIKILGQPAASDTSKKAALWGMAIPVLASGGVNVLAPAPHWILRVLAGFVVFAIPVAETMRVLMRPDFVKIEQLEMAVEANLAKPVIDETTQQQAAAPAVDQRVLNKQRMVAAEKARDLAKRVPDMSIAALMRATGCGRGAAKKAIELANDATTQPAVAV